MRSPGINTVEPARSAAQQHAAWSGPGRLGFDHSAGALGGGSDERADAEVLHVPLGSRRSLTAGRPRLAINDYRL